MSIVRETKKAILQNDSQQRERVRYEQKRGWPYHFEEWATYRGIHIDEEVQNMLETRQKVRLLDVGTGIGQLLLEGKMLFNEKLEAKGIALHLPPIVPAGCEITQENIERFHQPNSFDIITSRQCFPYLANPLLALKNIYKSLSLGGVAYIFPVPLLFESHTQQETFLSYLQDEYEFEIEEGNSDRFFVKFRKTKLRLHLPVSVLEYDKNPTSFIDGKQAVYRLIFS